MKTVIHEGKEYQIGALYEFGVDGDWLVGVLARIDENSHYPYKWELGEFSLIREIQNSVIGTIKDAPVELEDGCAYRFDYTNGTQGMSGAVMAYRAIDDCFYFDNFLFKRKYCTNIVKLVPEVK